MNMTHELVDGDLVTYHGKNYQVSRLDHDNPSYAMTLISPRGKHHVYVPHDAVEFVLWTGKRNPKF